MGSLIHCCQFYSKCLIVLNYLGRRNNLAQQDYQPTTKVTVIKKLTPFEQVNYSQSIQIQLPKRTIIQNWHPTTTRQKKLEKFYPCHYVINTLFLRPYTTTDLIALFSKYCLNSVFNFWTSFIFIIYYCSKVSVTANFLEIASGNFKRFSNYTPTSIISHYFCFFYWSICSPHLLVSNNNALKFFRKHILLAE